MFVSVCLSVTTITKKIVDGFVPNFTGSFLGEREDQVPVSLRSVEGCGNSGQTLHMAHYYKLYHSIKCLEITTISSSGTSLVSKTMGQECWYEFCCLGSTPGQDLIL